MQNYRLGNYIRQRRQELNLTQEQVCAGISIQPNASLTMIGLAAPTSTAVGIVLNVCFFLYLERKEKNPKV